MSHYPLGLVPAKGVFRLLAFIFDMLLLTALMVGLDFLLPAHSTLRHYSDLVFFITAFSYFALLSSKLGQGQTLGKKIMGICTTHANGDKLTIVQSMLRYNQLFFPLYIVYSTSHHFSFWLVAISYCTLLFSGYLFFFNWQTGQLLHGLATQSLVVPATVDNEHTTLKNKFWQVHYSIGGVLVVCVLCAQMYFHYHPTTHLLSHETELIRLLPHISRASVTAENKAENNISTLVTLDEPMDSLNTQELAEQIQYVIGVKYHGALKLHSRVEIKYERNYGVLHWHDTYFSSR